MPTNFESAQKFRAWLKGNWNKSAGLKIGFRTKPNGHACMTYDDAVSEALCFGWCVGRRSPIDAGAFVATFRPRTLNARWSADDVALAESLAALGKLGAPGLAALNARAKPKPKGLPADATDLSPMMLAELKRHPAAFAYFQRIPPSHRRKWVGWVMGAKQEKTRSDRFARLMMDMARPRG